MKLPPYYSLQGVGFLATTSRLRSFVQISSPLSQIIWPLSQSNSDFKKRKIQSRVKDAYICEVHVSHGYEAPTVLSIQGTAIRAVGKTHLFIGFGGVGNDVI